MKKFIIICFLALVALAGNAQQSYQTFTQDTTEGVQTIYFTAGAQAKYMGLVSFEFTADGFASADDATVILQGTNDAWTKIYNIDTVAYSSATATNYIMSDGPAYDAPAKYLNYRLKCVGATGDTVLFKNVIFIYKR